MKNYKGLEFRRIGDTDKYNLYIDGKPYKKELTMDEVMQIISEKDKEKEK